MTDDHPQHQCLRCGRLHPRTEPLCASCRSLAAKKGSRNRKRFLEGVARAQAFQRTQQRAKTSSNT